MKPKHYKEKLSAFLNHELPDDERQKVGEHLFDCAECRREHDAIKFGAELAKNLTRSDAPPRVWNNIEAGITGKSAPRFLWFKPKIAAFAGLLLIMTFSVFASLIYINFFQTESNEISKNEPENQRQIQPSENEFAAWQVENLSGKPNIINSSENERLEIGGILETDEKSSAKIEVADIGQVEIAPNSLVKLVNSSQTEHRLALEYGALEAKIFAPPRLFVVDTPTAKAVDLGCAYKLEVDKAGNSKLHVTSGYVALERDGRESIVPAGAFCLTRRGKGIGTPYLESASASFQKALYEFDFENGKDESLKKILAKARRGDTLTLWHLLSRVSGDDREKVLDKIISFKPLPEIVTREGVLRLEKEMLDELRYEVETFWYETF
jgi:hypothetical protein